MSESNDGSNDDPNNKPPEGTLPTDISKKDTGVMKSQGEGAHSEGDWWKKLEALKPSVTPDVYKFLEERLHVKEGMKQHNEQKTKQIEALITRSEKLKQHNEQTTKQIEALTTRYEQKTKQIEALITRDEQTTKQIEALIKNNKELKTDLALLKANKTAQDIMLDNIQSDTNRRKK